MKRERKETTKVGVKNKMIVNLAWSIETLVAV